VSGVAFPPRTPSITPPSPQVAASLPRHSDGGGRVLDSHHQPQAALD